MAVIATGFFDGVHQGHRHIISTLVSSARERGEEAVVVTFAQHPRAVLQQDATSLRLLTSRSEKEDLLRSLGVDRIEVMEFTREFAAMPAGEYLQMLRDRLGCSCLVIGYDTRMGSDLLGAGDLVSLAQGLGIEVIRCEAVGDVSSTRIRAALADGRVEEAAQLLGRPYSLSGIVVPGKQLGRVLGFPTANLQISDPLRLVPARGVYLSRTTVLGRSYWSMTNVGDVVETNIFDFQDDIYSLDIRVSFVARIRDMKIFYSLDELRDQISRDRGTCLEIISGS